MHWTKIKGIKNRIFKAAKMQALNDIQLLRLSDKDRKMKLAEDLKPCPGCDESKDLHVDTNKTGQRIVCKYCNVSTKFYKEFDELKLRWNIKPSVVDINDFLVRLTMNNPV